MNSGLISSLGLMAIPFLPQSFTDRMSTIQNYQADQSASTRIAVWEWTWEYAKANPFGGGFDSYRLNEIRYELAEDEDAEDEFEYELEDDGPVEIVDESRAFHSSYFEMLGEQGFPGLILWLLIHFGGVWRMEVLRRRYTNTEKESEKWVAPLAIALQHGHIIYLVGSLFVGIAFQPFVYKLVALQIGLDTYVNRRSAEAKWRPIVKRLSSGTNPKSLPEPSRPYTN